MRTSMLFATRIVALNHHQPLMKGIDMKNSALTTATVSISEAANDQLPLPQFQQLLTCEEVCRVFKITRVTLYKHIENGTFTRPMKFGERLSRWLVSDVQKVFDARCAGATADEVRQLVSQIHAEREQRRIAA